MPRLPASAGVSRADAARFESARGEGNAAYRAGRYADAVQHYTRAEEINPCSALAPANRALAWLKLAEYEKAAADCSVALALLDDFLPSPSADNALRVKCLLRRAEARRAIQPPLLSAAARDYQDALALEPANSRALDALTQLRAAGVRPLVHDGEPRPRPSIDIVDRPQLSNSSSPSLQSHEEDKTNGSHRPDEHRLVRDFPLMRISDAAVDALTAKMAAEVPRDATDFERVWRSLRGQPAKQGAYLHVVGASRVHALLGHGLTPQLLTEIVHSLQALVESDAEDVCGLLHAVTTTPRFNIASMLLDSSSKHDVDALCTQLGNTPRVQAIRSAFDL